MIRNFVMVVSIVDNELLNWREYLKDWLSTSTAADMSINDTDLA